MADRLRLADLLQVLACCRTAIFLVSVLAISIPFRLLDPRWQLIFCSAVADHGTILLPEDGQLEQRGQAVRRWASLIVFLLLVLIPLKIQAS